MATELVIYTDESDKEGEYFSNFYGGVLPGGKVLVAHGQDEEVRALVIFDAKWLYAPRRRSTFENQLADWSTHKYIKGIVGHCAYNRVLGPRLIPHSDRTDAKVLQIRHPIDPNLVFDKDGAQ